MQPAEPGPAAGAGVAGRNVLREDFPLPVCVLRAAALARNLARFQRFSEDAGVLLCPHAKTSMSPALFGRQLAAGAWGLTFATGAQVRVAREHGVPRIFYANELVGAADIRFVCDELRRDPGFEFYCLADSVAAVRLLAARVAAARPGRRLNVLVEGGLPGGRCGVRDLRTARAVTRDLVDYHVPVNADVPAIDVLIVDELDPHVNEIGAKGLGEIGITGGAAAIANAIYHATGKRVRDLPITVEQLLPAARKS